MKHPFVGLPAVLAGTGSGGCASFGLMVALHADPLFGTLNRKGIAFWLAMGWVGFFVFRFGTHSQAHPEDQAALGAAFSTTVQLVFFLFAWFFWLPRFWQQRRYVLFAGTGLAFVVFLVPVHWYILVNYTTIPEYVADPRVVNWLWTVAFLADTIILLLLWGLWAGLVARQTRKRMAQLELQKAQAELLLLKTQIQPHFLLNTLNNLYALSLYDPNRLPDLLLKLSEILQYVLYDCLLDRVPLAKERQYLHSYVDLFRIKAEHTPAIQFHWEATRADATVPPMVLQPLVENAIKHSHVLHDASAWVDIRISATPTSLELVLQNTIPSLGTPTQNGLSTPGIGLENIRKRLEIISPGGFTLATDATAGVYRTHLVLPLKP